ncbi:MAG: hypothetical protein IPL61_25440 [Myxococcales bacterium]|nr:hypothetical protein [Myxococcales bacterium]
MSSAPAPHTSPALVQPVAPPAGTTAHTPRVAPAATLHRPLQHSLPNWQVSPIWVQCDGASLQTPPSQ